MIKTEKVTLVRMFTFIWIAIFLIFSLYSSTGTWGPRPFGFGRVESLPPKYTITNDGCSLASWVKDEHENTFQKGNSLFNSLNKNHRNYTELNVNKKKKKKSIASCDNLFYELASCDNWVHSIVRLVYNLPNIYFNGNFF